jgi:hypothetical protein
MGKDKDEESSFVFIRDPEYAWIPAVKKGDNGKQAQVSVPQYPDEQSIICDGGQSAKKFEDDVVDLKEYNRGLLPMQNVNASGQMKCFPDMVELPFLHEVCFYVFMFYVL